ncbi:MAG: cytochrome-c peroxidase [Geminicoccaceae bacterium]
MPSMARSSTRLKAVLLASVAMLLVAATRQGDRLTMPPAAPITDADYYDVGAPNPAKVELGRLLFFDKILSGNRNISCATCHHPTLASGDGLALSIGEGGAGLGEERFIRDPVLGRVPRNAQPLYNIGAKSYSSLFHDGRVESDPTGAFKSGFWTSAREQLPEGLDNVLAAQAMFPVLSHLEMAGHKGENPIATAAALDHLDGPDGAWALLAKRLRAVPNYVASFKETFSEIDAADDITFVHAANAIAAFETVGFRADRSPYDAYLRTGDASHLPARARRGMTLFYGKAGCSTCHEGKFQTDQRFHAIAMPQIGPGKGHGEDAGYWRASGFHDRLEDEGRYRVSFDPADMFRFRTPSLRNVAKTGPWGHSGAYATLEEVVRHHLDPVAALNAYGPPSSPLNEIGGLIERTGSGSALVFAAVKPERRPAFMERDGWVQGNDTLRSRIAEANDLEPTTLSNGEIIDLLAFLETLTDPGSVDRQDLVPASVPSGLPVAD